MALFIKKIHDVLADLEGKNIASSHPPEQVDRVLYMIIVDLFNKYYDNYVKTRKISNYLLPFKRQATVTLINGIGDLPPDFAQHRAVYFGNVQVDIVEDKFWNGRLNSKLSPPSLTTPIGRIENIEAGNARKLEIPVTGISTVKLQYFKTPIEPKYAYTIVGTRYVYDEANSVDVEFPIGMYPDIVVRLLNAFGITLREGQLIQITEVLKTQEQIK